MKLIVTVAAALISMVAFGYDRTRPMNFPLIAVILTAFVVWGFMASNMKPVSLVVCTLTGIMAIMAPSIGFPGMNRTVDQKIISLAVDYEAPIHSHLPPDMQRTVAEHLR